MESQAAGVILLVAGGLFGIYSTVLGTVWAWRRIAARQRVHSNAAVIVITTVAILMYIGGWLVFDAVALAVFIVCRIRRRPAAAVR